MPDPALIGGMTSISGRSWVTSLRLPPVRITASGVPCLSVIRGRFRPMFHPEMACSVFVLGSRQEMVFSLVRRRAMRSVMAMWMTASERVGRVS